MSPIALVKGPASPAAPRAVAALPADVLGAATAAAAAVDDEGRFPREAFAELKRYGLLGALVPGELGGGGLDLRTVAGQVQGVGAACSSAGMVLAMHHIQVACLVRHARGSAWHAAFLGRVQERQLLLASSTSEVEVGGSLRTSRCAVLAEHGRFTLTKHATAISYGAEADAILATARAHVDAPEGDQALAVLERADTRLQRTSTWDAMGMRGTGTEAYVVEGAGDVAQVLPEPFAEIAAATMVPVSHVLWGALWTGVAGAAVERARQALRARRKPDGALPQGAARLAAAVETLQMAEARVASALDAFDWEQPASPSFAAAALDNGLKASVSEACLSVVQVAMGVCGFAGYARGGPYSVSRHLRDLNSAPLMVANERVRESSARLLLAQRPKLGLAAASVKNAAVAPAPEI